MMRRYAHHLFPIVAFAFTAVAFYPGHLSFDSAFQLWQVRTGRFANLSPVAMTGLWSLVHRAWPGSGGMFVLHVLLYWAGVWLAVCTLFDRPWQRVAAGAFAALATPAHLIVVHLWTDAALVAALGFGTALILRADAKRTRAPLYAALPFLLYGGLVRHNALPALVPLAAWWVVVHARASPRASAPSLAPGKAAFAMVVALAAVFATGRALDRALVVQRMTTFSVVQLWDLAAMSLATKTMLVPQFVQPPGFTMAHLRERYSRFACVPLFTYPHGMRDGVSAPFSEDEQRALWDAWLAAIRAHPSAYAAHRLSVTSALFGRYRNDRPSDLAFVPAIVPYADNPPIALNATALHRSTVAYYTRAVGWWVYAPIVWIVVTAVVGGMAWRRRDDFRGRCALAAAASGFLYVAPLTLVAPSTELRYSAWLFAAGTLALLSFVASSVTRRS